MYEQIFKLHAKLLHAIAHSRRLEIIHLLRGQTLSVGEITKMLDLPQANISQHLQILRLAGVVKTQKRGKLVEYGLAHPNVIAASDLMREILIERNQGRFKAKELSASMLQLVPIVHDPVCGMRVSPKTAGAKLKLKRKEYYFCATGCMRQFKKEPEAYVKK